MSTLARRSRVPFGLDAQKPRHYREMARIAWENRAHLGYAFRVLRDGVCDGCALGTSGLSDFTMEGTHLCLVRLNLLRLNTLDAFRPEQVSDVSSLRALSPKQLLHLGRIPYPLRRRRGEPGFTRISWTEALTEIGQKLRASDPQRIACYLTSRGLTNEVYYAAQKAWRFLGSPHIDNAGRLCHSPSTSAMKHVLGVSASTVSYRDLYGTDLVVLAGSNPANDQPVMVKYLAEAKKLGTRVVVINTLREPGLERYYVPSSAGSALFGSDIADAFFDVRPGGDQALFYAVQKRLLERGAIDRAFIDAHTEGFDDYARGVSALDAEQLQANSGTPAAQIEALVDLLAGAKNAIFIWSMGLTQHAHGTQTVEALLSLALSRGYVGRKHAGLMPIRGHSGVQGGAEMGAYATAFPGSVAIDDASARALEAQWGFRVPAHDGMDTCSMLEAAHAGNLELLYAVGGNFIDTLPQPADVQAALERVPVRVHQDIVLSRAMLVDPQDAVYLLPAKTRYEHAGGVTETTTERRVIYSPEVPGHEVGEAREEWRIAIDLAKAAWPERAAAIDFPDAASIRSEIARVIPSYRGIEQLAAKGDQFQWGGERLCEGGVFPRPGGKARFIFSAPPETARVQSEQEPGALHLGTRRGKQFNSMVQAEVDQLTGAARDHVLMNVDDMRERGLAQHAPVRVTSAHGVYDGRAFAAPLVRGAVQMHWPEANVLIASGPRDPDALVPDYNAWVQVKARNAAPSERYA